MYHVNLFKNATLYANFIQNYFPGLIPTGETGFIDILTTQNIFVLLKLSSIKHFFEIEVGSSFLVR